ncbi:DUF3293 domain-containing protein [Paraburkholderia diazotrophica]|uniref:DUF3293 domain-containing protein n=1 Tax=Paraburkholderia diazotrophica TaxID=667676 RepID=A0A1H7BZD4_9BURK|nr:DUF3293 domain-containing protein [Paraburkholderia diazotrophica]SEJ82738.1 Protein of unknown function [Paraburkholderia diazotrophica]
MISDSQIPRATIQAYLETHYCVHGSMPTTLKIGEFNASLAAIHDAHAVRNSAFITACNPFSRMLDDAANVDLQRALALELSQRGLTFIGGIGRHPSNGWPGEPSFLVPGISVEDAKALGMQFGQNAVVWSGGDAVPQLVLLR